jgi:hypothetical protein
MPSLHSCGTNGWTLSPLRKEANEYVVPKSKPILATIHLPLSQTHRAPQAPKAPARALQAVFGFFGFGFLLFAF